MSNPQGSIRAAASAAALAVTAGLVAIMAAGAQAAPSPLKKVSENLKRFSRTAAIVRDADIPVTPVQAEELGNLLGTEKGARLAARFRKGTVRAMQVRQPLPSATDRSAVAAAFLAARPGLFGANVGKSELRLRYRRGAGRTGEALRFAQYYRGIPVFASEAAVIVDQGELREVWSGLRGLPADPAGALLGKADLAKSVKAHLGHGKFSVKSAEPIWFNPALIKDGASDGLFICWKAIVENRGNARYQPMLIIDARDGSIRYSENRIREAMHRRIQHATSGAVLREEGGAPSGDADADAGYDNSKYHYDIFAAFGRDSYDNGGAQMVMNVHAPDFCPNAWWDGSTTNFCDGMATRDITVHEWTHATTEFTAGLIYADESGALNESMSDIFGAISDSNFTMGEGSSIGIIRSMENPPLYGDPDHYSDYIPGGDVHNNSGINNKCGYLIINGGTHHGVTVAGQGQSAAARIFYEALLRMVPSSQYQDAAEAAFAGATAAFGAGSPQVKATQAAYAAIGVYFDPDAAIQLAVSQADFGKVPVNTDKVFSLKVHNRGASTLNVTSASVTGAGFTGPTTAFSIAPKDSGLYPITFHPSAVTTYSGTLVLNSNDPSDPSISLPLAGQGIIPPRISVTPGSFKVEASNGNAVHRTMTISNPSAGVLEYSLSGASAPAVAAARKYGPEHFRFRDRKSGDDRKGAPVTQGAGGPDAFGYTWADSDQPGGPAFAWTDISATGSLLSSISSCLDCFETVTLDKPFNFYGQDYSSVNVASHGFLNFGAGTAQYFNTPLPSADAPRGMIAGFWDDVSPVNEGEAYWQTFADRTIFQWNNISHFGSGGSYTFQIVLKKDGSIFYYYKSLQGELNSATIGIQDQQGADGLTVAYNAAYAHDSLAIRIASKPPWLKASPLAGTIQPGASAQVDLTFDAQGLQANTYAQNLDIIHNGVIDPNPYAVPCTLIVDGFRGLTVSPASLAFGNVWSGSTGVLKLTLKNTGSEATVVNSITSTNGLFTVTPAAPVTVLPFSEAAMTVAFKPLVNGPASGLLQITSNAEDSANWTISVSGTGTEPPLASLAPDSLLFALAPGDAPADKTSVLANIGGDVLRYTVGNVVEVPPSATPFRAQAPNTALIYSAENYKHAFVPGQVIVAFKAGKTDFAEKSLAAAAGVSARRELAVARDPRTKARSFSARNLSLMTLSDKGRNAVLAVIERIKGDANVAYAEPNYLVSAVEIPDDPSFGELYGMHNSGQAGGTPDADIDAPEAWNRTHGNPNLMIGVIDTGIDYLHPDLAPNMWTNPGEIAGNGLDDDGNGYADDIHGYDFVNNDGDPMDDHYHGTHCAGTIGGAGNNGVGVAGVVWQARLVGLKFLDAGGGGTTEAAIDAIAYANAMHIPITSNSWGGGGFSQALKDVIEAGGAAGYLFIAAAGNSGVDMDVSVQYPAGYDSPSIVSVAATDRNDMLAGFSNYGLTSVDLGAPGVDVYSCAPGASYQNLSGTSMATPHVSGAAALLWGYNYQLTGAELKGILMASSDPVPALAGKSVSGGRLNVDKALELAGLPWLTISPKGPADIAPGQSQVLTATVDAGGFTAGRHVGLVQISTNDPAHPTLPLTVIADVAACRKLEVDPDTLGFATVWIGQEAIKEITLANVCNEAVSISEFSVFGAGFSASASAPLSVPAFGKLKVKVRFAPSASGSAVGQIAIVSNAQDNPSLSVALSGSGVAAPQLTVTPAKIDVKLAKGSQIQKPITISNPGGADLEYRITGAASAESAAVKRYGPEHFGFRSRAQGDDRKGDPVLLGSGGPDAFGYTWIDSDQPGGPAYEWNDISLTGTMLNTVSGCLDCYEQVGLDVPFPFYGQSHTSVFVASHGFVTFGMGSAQFYNYPLPSTTAPPNLIAGFWDDVSPVGNGEAYFQQFADRVVFQWNNISHYGSGGVYTFQIVLKHDGTILYYYHTLQGEANSATVGIQNGSGTDGLGIAYNAPYVHEGMAVRIASNPPWLKISSAQGIVPPGGAVTLQATFDAAGMESGAYSQDLGIHTNAPVAGSAVVVCNLTVEGMRLRNLQAGLSGSPLVKGNAYSIRNLKAGGAGAKILKGAAHSVVLE